MKAEIEDIKTEKQLETLKNPGEKSHKLQELKRQREDEQFKQAMQNAKRLSDDPEFLSRSPHYQKTQVAFDNSEIEGYAFMREDISPETTFYGGMINEFYTLRDLATCILVLAFMDVPKMQVLLLVPVYFYFAWFVWKRNPFRSKIVNKLHVLNDLCSAVLLLGFSILDLLGEKLTERLKYNLIGSLMIFVIIVMMISNIATGCGMLVIELIKWCKQENEEKKLEAELDALRSQKKPEPEKAKVEVIPIQQEQDQLQQPPVAQDQESGVQVENSLKKKKKRKTKVKNRAQLA